MRPMLCDVKYRAELFEKWPMLKLRLKAAKRFANANGYSYSIKTEVEIRSPLLTNATFLLPYLRCEPDPEHEKILTSALSVLAGTTPRELLDRCNADQWQSALMIPTLWCLVGRRAIGTDLASPLSMQSPIWSAGRS